MGKKEDVASLEFRKKVLKAAAEEIDGRKKALYDDWKLGAKKTERQKLDAKVLEICEGVTLPDYADWKKALETSEEQLKRDMEEFEREIEVTPRIDRTIFDSWSHDDETFMDFDLNGDGYCDCAEPKIEKRGFQTLVFDFCVKCKKEFK